MEPKLLEFDVVEYIVFALMLLLSALIGVYYGFIKGGQDTVDGYFLGGKQMGLFPISMSLVSSFISGITILGLPTEIYTYGTQYMTAGFSFFTIGVLCAYVFLPVFYKLQLISVYQYMEMRFNKKVRKLVSLFFTLSLLIYIPLVIYAPALAINQVSGVNIQGISLLISVVCIFYTTFGGLRAVVWTDTIQTVLMVASCVFVAVIGTMRAGGVSAIFQAAKEGDRLEFDNFDPDPTQRTTVWTLLIGQTFAWTAGSTINPSATQRFVALNTIGKARWSVVFYQTGCFVLFILSAYMGLVIYAEYKSCDLLATGLIESADQILPYYVLDVIGNYKGIPGLFLAGVVSAALSTMSAGLNTVSGTIYEDFLEPVMGKTTERRASNIMKLLSAVFGGICVLLVMVIDKLGKNLVEISNAFGALTAGANLGMFLLGMVFPQATSLGAIVGGVSGLAAMSWVIIGSRAAMASGAFAYEVKPISVDGCPFNITGMDIKFPPPATSDGVFPFYQLSIFYYVPLGCITTILVGLLTSYITGPNKIEDVDRSLLTPVIYRFLPDYEPVPIKETELHQIHVNKELTEERRNSLKK